MKWKSIFLFSVMIASFIGVAAWADPIDIVWTDDVAHNPVIVSPGVTDANRAYYGCVIFDSYANKWRAWFDASSGADVTYGESSGADGVQWGSYALCKGFGTSKQSKPFVIQLANDSFRMWYCADNRGGGYMINTCVSKDGVNWTNDEWINGIAEPNPVDFGPVERFAAVRLQDGSFVAYVCCQEPEIADAPPDGKFLHRYTSPDGINWTWTNYTGVNDGEGMGGMEFSSVVKHPEKAGVWYAWGNPSNSSGPFSSFVSTDDGLTFTLDEKIVLDIGEVGTQAYNKDRNYHPSATYMGNGQWVMFRSVAEPKATAIAMGVEDIGTPVGAWELY